MKKILGTALGLLLASSIFATDIGSTDYVAALRRVTRVMINDVTSPVAASRYYAYVTLASSEYCTLLNQGKYSLDGLLAGYHIARLPDSLRQADLSFGAVYVVWKMGERLLPSGPTLQAEADSFRQQGMDHLPAAVYQASVSLASLVVDHILEYSRSDGFSKLSGYRKYTPLEGDAYWKPTPPEFRAPIEPDWNRLRPFVIDSAQQFVPARPAVYDTARNSPYYHQLYEVYETVNKLNKERREIASFWDCNPFAVQQIGHVEFGLKKISPGGHWMCITGIACRKNKLSVAATAYVHSLVAITLADAFISCWDEKYRSNRVRPETAINLLIDRRWRPLLQTPPFPEYTSGHSVVSTAAAYMLTALFGDNYRFSDDSETDYGLPIRRFRSFIQASQEAAISRLYGGIHYRDAVEWGQQEGKAVGEYVISQLKKAGQLSSRF